VRVDVQLHATLTAFLPPGSRDGVAVLDVAAPATVADLIKHLGIPADLSRVVLVNGHDVDEETLLRIGDVVDIFPPLAGGSESGWYTRKALWKRLGTRWASRTSNPVSGSRQAGGGFDSHTLPPRFHEEHVQHGEK
jgi:sulfur carrier protein ThiS